MADPLWMEETNQSTILFHETNLTLDSLEALGPSAQAFFVSLYSLTSMLALTGNFLVILVEIYGKRSAQNLRKFLINLAISDILIGVFSVPFIYTDVMFGHWMFHPLLCPTSQFVQLLSVFVTTFTLTAIAVERYYATLHPLSTKSNWLRSHCHLILLAGWVFGSFFASFVVVHTKVVSFNYQNKTLIDCRHDVDWDENEFKIYILMSVVLTFVLPLIFMTCSYGAIGRQLLQCPFLNDPVDGNSFSKRNSEIVDKMKVFKMLVAVVILFALCWFPIKVFMLLMAFWPSIVDIDTTLGYYFYFGSYFLCHWLSMANSFVNPIIYCFMSKSFRADLFDLISEFCRRITQPSIGTTDNDKETN